MALREIPGTGRKRKKKPTISGARGPETEEKICHAIRGGCPQLSYILRFGRPDTQGWENPKYRDFTPFWPRTALSTERNPGCGPKTEKHNFPVPGVLLGGETGRPKFFSPKGRKFSTVCVLANQTPTGRKSRNAGISGHFGLGRPLALRKILGPGR